jgi:hypothetical protein
VRAGGRLGAGGPGLRLVVMADEVTALVAGTFNFNQAALFEIKDSQQREAVKVSFS